MAPQTILVVLVSLVGAVTDMRTGKVYNWLTYPAAVAGVLLSLVFSPPSPWESLAGLGAALVVFGVLRKVGRMGAGDVKLIAAIGALKGLGFLVFVSFYSIVLGGMVAVMILAWERRLLPTLRWATVLAASAVVPGVKARPLEAPQAEMPFAPAIFLGTLYCLYLEATGGPFALY